MGKYQNIELFEQQRLPHFTVYDSFFYTGNLPPAGREKKFEKMVALSHRLSCIRWNY